MSCLEPGRRRVVVVASERASHVGAVSREPTSPRVTLVRRRNALQQARDDVTALLRVQRPFELENDAL